MSYYYTNRLGRALLFLDSAMFVFKSPYLSWNKAWLLIYLGRYQETIDNLKKFFEAVPDQGADPRTQAWLSISYFHTGRPYETDKILDSLQSLSEKTTA